MTSHDSALESPPAAALPALRRRRLSEAACVAPLESGGIYLAVEDDHGDWSRLRDDLRRALGHDADVSRPHVTLLHPRTSTLAERERAWEVLAGWRPDIPVSISQLALIREAGDGRWDIIGTFPLRADRE